MSCGLQIFKKSVQKLPMMDYHQLRVWQQAHSLVKALYKTEAGFPKTEKYRIVDQLLRAAVSIPTNIAEGSARYTSKDFARFLNIAAASASETEYLIELSRDLNYLEEPLSRTLIKEITIIRKQLLTLIKKLNYE